MKLTSDRFAHRLTLWPAAAYGAATLFFVVGASRSFVAPAYAACISGAQCEANGFSETPAANDAFAAIGGGLNNAALVARNGGDITGTALIISAPGGNNANPNTDENGVYIESGGAITLTGNSSITARRGVHAEGLNSAFTMTGGQINTAKDAVRVVGQASAALDNVVITTQDNITFGVLSQRGTATLTDTHITVNGSGTGVGSVGSAGQPGSLTMQGGSITIHGPGGTGAVANGDPDMHSADIHLDGVTITATHATNPARGMALFYKTTGTLKNSVVTAGSGVEVRWGAAVHVDNSAITSTGPTNRYGLLLRNGSASFVNHSSVDAPGANRFALAILGNQTEVNDVLVDASTVTATGAGSIAIVTNGATNTVTVANNSTIHGDRLMLVRNCVSPNCFPIVVPSHVTFTASDSQLIGHAQVRDTSNLTMNLGNGAHWTLRPSTTGVVRSDVTFLTLAAGSHIVFDPTSPQRQMLVVGSGGTGGNPAVYNAPLVGDARIELNTWLNAGGTLADQQTDRLIVNGDISGTTVLVVNPIAGSPGADTGGTASDGISLAQASGNAAANAFVLNGTYVTVGGQPWRYSLHAWGPGSANGLADGSQRLVDGANPHWDWRLQSEFMDTFGGFKPVPQIANYLTAPTALFQSGLLDVAMLHRRLGDTRQMGTRPTDTRNHREFFLRTYGGDYDYRSNRPTNAYGYGADIRYTAAQIGGTVHAGQTAHSSTRIGLAANYGQLRFAPFDEPDARKTRMDTWSVSPTLNWQHEASGAYVDAVLAWGQFRGDVTTTLRSRAATLKGTRQTVSVETGLPLIVGTVTAIPQAQVVYQRLDFDRVRDVDGFDVSLGTPKQWTFKAGMEVRTTRFTAAGSAIRLYGKTHFVQHLNRHRQVWLGEAFALGKSGTLLENGAGVDAVLAKGQVTLFADLTRQHRVSRRAGSQGWSANMGMKLRF